MDVGQEIAVNDERPRRRPGRRPATGARYARLAITVEQDMITALALEAQRRGMTLSALTRMVLADWMRREMPVGEMPHDVQTTESKEGDGR
ncbi:MAG: hypothetical protein ACR2M3_09570 [Thermomicrobiales bacterium]